MVVKVRSDNEMEFKNTKFSEFCDYKGINHGLSYSWKTQGDRAVEQKTRVIQESTRVMLSAKQLPFEF